MEDYKYLFKVVLVGNAGVGKTCLVRKFTQGIFPPGQSATIGVDFMIKTVKVGDDKIKLQIWDTAGQERFRSITQSYYRSAHAIVLVYDVACQPSFDCLPEWLSEIEQYANRKVLKILVGNKVDKEDEREVPERIGKSFADANGFDYFLETSALDATNVDALFQQVATRLTNEMKTSDDRYNGYKGDGSGTPAISLIDRAHQQLNETSERPRKRQAERSAAKSTASTPLSFSAARSDDGNDDEFPDEEYAMKRQRNNAAVNKTRQKKRQEEVDTVKRVKQLREENSALERTVESLRHELGLLKEMVLSFASNRTRANEPNAEEKPGNFRGSGEGGRPS